MKKNLVLIVAFLLVSSVSFAQTIEFEDGFESGTDNWVLTGQWGTSSSESYSGTVSLTESLSGTYGDDTESYATMATGVDLDQAGEILSAELTFWNKYIIELGFDYMYVDVSTNDFANFTNVAIYDGEQADWTEQTISLGGFVGNNNVKVRFRFISDGDLDLDGMYIDNFVITSKDYDDAVPLVVYTPAEFYEGELDVFTVVANIYDVSGIADAVLEYTVDGGETFTITGTNNIDEYTFEIPQTDPGSWIQYRIKAIDDTDLNNTAITDYWEYISGYYYSYDDGEVDFYSAVGADNENGITGAAVKVTIGDAQLTTLLIRGYTDVDHSNDDITVHVWDDNGGVPGDDVITPFTITPEATLSNTSAMTRVDLRDYYEDLSNLEGDYFIGYMMPSGNANTTISDPGAFSRSYLWDGSVWTLQDSDYHFRAITSEPQSDIEGPTIAYAGEENYLGNLDENLVSAEITDMSGIASTTLFYSIDGGSEVSVDGVSTKNGTYEFTIPAQPAGNYVEYRIEAIDNFDTPFTSVSSTFKYVAGIHLIHETAAVTAFTTVGEGNNPTGACEKFNLSNNAAVVAFLVRNYAVAGKPNADMNVQVWADDNGLPGDELITSFPVSSTSTIENNMQYTYIDLRDHLSTLGDIVGDFYVGFEVTSGTTKFLVTEPATVEGMSYIFASDAWNQYTQFGYHIRAVVSDAPIVSISKTETSNIKIYPNPASDIVNIVSYSEITNIIATNISGQIMYNSSPNTNSQLVNLNSFSSGVYIFRISTESKTITEKVIVK